MDVELRHLRAFVAVARSRSFTRASGHLLITQPALTRTIQQLEAALQVTLLERTSRHVELTAAGREFWLTPSGCSRTWTSPLASVRAHVTIRLGFSWLLPDPWAQHAVGQFERRRAPRSSLVRSDDPLAAVEQASIDVAVIRGTIPDSLRCAASTCSTRCGWHVLASTPGSRLRHLDWARGTRVAAGGQHRERHDRPVVLAAGHGPAPDRRDRELRRVAGVGGRRPGIGVVPDVAMRRNIHSAVRFIPLVNAPSSPVWLAFLSRVRESLMRQFVEAAVAAASSGDGRG